MNAQEQQIVNLAARSPIAAYTWKGRGRAPIGYIKGMALVYARVVDHLRKRDRLAVAMAIPLGSPDRDALAWYNMTGAGEIDRLRVLFALMIGLGLRESAGNYGEGRDMSASNTSPDTAEAGVFQMSWDITRLVPDIVDLFKYYTTTPIEFGLADVFHEGVKVTLRQLENYGASSTNGYKFQYQAKARPAFAVEAAAIGLRKCRKHWGPINRKEAEVRPEAIELLKQIEMVVLAQVNVPEAPLSPKPQPQPEYRSVVMRLLDWITGKSGG